jgi:hypothetical protein
LKFNAKAGRFYVKHADVAMAGEVEITNPRLAIDFANIKTGWILYSEGGAPQKLWDVNNIRQPQPAQVGLSKWREGFEVMVYGGDVIPALRDKLGLREFNSNSNTCKSAIIKAHSVYEAGRAGNGDAIPVFNVTGVVPVKAAKATNYEPVFALEKWVPRSAIPAFATPAGNGHAAQNQLQPMPAPPIQAQMQNTPQVAQSALVPLVTGTSEF